MYPSIYSVCHFQLNPNNHLMRLNCNYNFPLAASRKKVTFHLLPFLLLLYFMLTVRVEMSVYLKGFCNYWPINWLEIKAGHQIILNHFCDKKMIAFWTTLPNVDYMNCFDEFILPIQHLDPKFVYQVNHWFILHYYFWINE